MKSISQLWSFKLNKEGYEFIEEVIDVNNVWGLFLPTYRTKENEDKGIFNLDVESNYVGMVIQYKDGHYECNINTVDFQAEYTEEELKKVIIKDIKQEVLETEYEENRNKLKEFYEANLANGNLKLVKGNEPVLSAEQVLLLSKIDNYRRFINEGIEAIKKCDNDLTNIKKKDENNK